MLCFTARANELEQVFDTPEKEDQAKSVHGDMVKSICRNSAKSVFSDKASFISS